VIVDEAGMLSTTKLAELADLADMKGWQIALVGDPLQFSAVGRGGMFGLLVDTFGAIELDRVHRFDNDWEREASLRLRRGDVTVAEVYEQHRRLHSGTLNQMERASVAAWWERRRAGNKGLLMSPTNEATERLNQRCQQTRINAGEIDPGGRHFTVGVSEVHAGDEIATRQNDGGSRPIGVSWSATGPFEPLTTSPSESPLFARFPQASDASCNWISSTQILFVNP